MANIDFEEYRAAWETGPHWELKREFMEKYQNDYPLDRLLCLAQAYSNIELLHCSYPEPLMREVYQLSCQLQGCKRFRKAEADLERRKKEKLEMHPKKAGKRSSSDEISLKPFKFIKFCSPKEASSISKSSNESDKNSNDIKCDTKVSAYNSGISTNSENFNKNSASEELNSNGAALVRSHSNALFSLSRSLDFDLIQRIAAAISKKCKTPLESIESAVEVSGLENLIKFIFVHDNASVICCQFYINSTLVATGRDSTEKSAKERAVQYGVEILSNLSHLPCKTLEDVKHDLQNWIKATNSCALWSEISSSNFKSKQLMSQLLEMKKNPTYADLHLILGIVHQLFGDKDILKKNKNMFAAQKIQEAIAKLKCPSQVYFFHFGEDPNTLLHLRIFHCDFVIKNILICHSKASSKKKARIDASEQGLKLLANFIENCEFDKQQNDQDQVQSLGINLESSKDLVLDISRNENKKNSMAKESINPTDREYLSINKQDKLDKLLHKRSKIENYLKLPDADNLSEIHINMSCKSRECYSLNKSGSQSTPELFKINHRLLTNSRNRQLIIFDSCESSYSNAASSILHASANKCKKQLKHEIKEIPVDASKNSAKLFRYLVSLDGEIIGKAEGCTEKEAKSNATENALQFLQNFVYTIKVKNEIEESFIISRSHILNAENPSSGLSENNVGCKMLKMMGWTGGGIGKTSGITEPIVASDHSFGQGLGFSTNKAQEKSFTQKIEALLKDYSKSNTTSDLIFSTEFSKEERKEIHRLATRYHLCNNSRGRGEQRQVFIGQKFSPMELLERLIEAGGSTPKYELQDRSVSNIASISQ